MTQINTDFNPSKDIPDLTGQVIFVTGGTAGLGAESFVQIAKHRPEVIYFTGRSASGAQDVISRVKATTPAANLVFIECDLTSLASVKAASDRFLVSSDRLDILMCNAGIAAKPPGLTKDGYELQFGTNHLGHALLIKKLVPTMRRTVSQHRSDARVVILTSAGFRGHPSGGIKFDTLKTSQDFGIAGSWLRYGQSKLANVLYAQEIARRYPELTAVSIHPGVVGTTLVSGMSFGNKLLVHVTSPFNGGLLSPEQGAYNQLWAAFGDKRNIENGNVYEPVGKPMKLGRTSSDDGLATRLWEWTDEALREC